MTHVIILVIQLKTEDYDFDNIFMNEKLCKNILVYDISYKILFGWKPLRIRFDEIEEFIRVDDKIRNLVLFGSNKNDTIYNRIRYLRYLIELDFLWFFFSKKKKKKKPSTLC